MCLENAFWEKRHFLALFLGPKHVLWPVFALPIFASPNYRRCCCLGERSRVVLLHVNIPEKIGSKNVLGIQYYKIQKGIPL
jgi:hypothetical protein